MLNQREHEELKQRAWEVMQMSFRRAGCRWPKWARKGRVIQDFHRIYKKAQIKNRFRFAYGKSGDFYQVDHIYPLHGKTVSGLHVPWNLHVILAPINAAKGTMVVEEYARPKPERAPNHSTRRFLAWFEESLQD